MTAVKATLQGVGKLRRAVERYQRQLWRKNKQSIDRYTRQTQLGVRGDVSKIFRRNRRAANAVRSKTYDNRRRGAAGIIYSKFGRKGTGRFVDYLSPYITGRDIRPRHGRYLAVPMQRGKRFRSPDKFRPGELDLVASGGRLFLVKRTRTRTRFAFLLVPRIKITKRIRPRRHIRRAARGLPRDLKRRVQSIRTRI